MRRALRWVGIVLASMVILIVAAGVAVYLLTNARFNATYAFSPAPFSLEADSASLARGAHIATIRGCVDCHGADLGGGPVIEAPPVAMLYATNLTSGEGGKAPLYQSDELWVRAIRHGIGVDDRGLMFMPAQEYQVLSNEDINDLIAYVKSVPPVDREIPETTIGPVGRLLFLAGQMELVPAELVDHENLRPPDRVEEAPTAEFGGYLATGCFGCHGHGLAGGPIPGAPPEFPPGANLTPDPETGLGTWSEGDFTRAMREGIRPDGTEIDPFMPVQLTSQMTDTEIRALWLHLQSLEPTPYGMR